MHIHPSFPLDGRVGIKPFFAEVIPPRWLGAAALALLLSACATQPTTPSKTPQKSKPSATSTHLEQVLSEHGAVSLADLFDAGPTAMSHDPHVAGSAQMSRLISTVMGLVGTPYLRGGTGAVQGFDCSGFVRSVYGEVTQFQLPRIARDQARATVPIARHELQAGDLVFFNTNGRAHSHVGIYIGQGRFVHSPKPGAAVRIEGMNTAYWTHRFDAARRVPLPETIASSR